MISFEVGKTYAEMTDHLTEWVVTARTKLFVTVESRWGIKRAKVKVIGDREMISPSEFSFLYADFEVGNASYLDFKNRVEIGNQKVADAMQEDEARLHKFIETLRAA